MRHLLSSVILIAVVLSVTTIWSNRASASIATKLIETKHAVTSPLYPQGPYQKAFFFKRKGSVKGFTKGVRSFFKQYSMRGLLQLRKAARSIGKQAQKLTGSIKPRTKQIAASKLKQVRLRAIRRAHVDIANGNVLNRTKLRPSDKTALGAYRNNELGQTAKKLSPELAKMAPAQMRGFMKQEGASARAVYSQNNVPYRGSGMQRQHKLEYSDGTVIRHKEKGDIVRKYPTYSVEVKVNKYKPDRGQDDIAFKVNRLGKPVPKNAIHVDPPSDMTSREKTFYRRAIGDAGHRGFQQVTP